MTRFWVRFACDQSGAAAIEYGLIAALIAVVIIGGATALGIAVNGQFSSVSSSVTTAGS
jgi:pilus assembly protein Flp/PilA